MIFFVIYAFTGTIYVQATGTSSEVNNASIAFVDEDQSALSKELMNAFYPPRFQIPETISAMDVETAMDAACQEKRTCITGILGKPHLIL